MWAIHTQHLPIFGICFGIVPVLETLIQNLSHREHFLLNDFDIKNPPPMLFGETGIPPSVVENWLAEQPAMGFK